MSVIQFPYSRQSPPSSAVSAGEVSREGGATSPASATEALAPLASVAPIQSETLNISARGESAPRNAALSPQFYDGWSVDKAEFWT